MQADCWTGRVKVSCVSLYKQNSIIVLSLVLLVNLNYLCTFKDLEMHRSSFCCIVTTIEALSYYKTKHESGDGHCNTLGLYYSHYKVAIIFAKSYLETLSVKKWLRSAKMQTMTSM